MRITADISSGCLPKEIMILLRCFSVRVHVHAPLPKSSEPINKFWINLEKADISKTVMFLQVVHGQEGKTWKQNSAIAHQGWQLSSNHQIHTYQPDIYR